jgi:hypothetical protein
MGGSWAKKEAPAQESAIAALQKVLDNRFVMLKNVPLKGLDLPIPLVLIGPPGIRVLYASNLKGVFQAREEAWEILDNTTQRFKAARPNLLNRTALMGRAVGLFLTSQNLKIESQEAALVFTNPGTHVDSTRPMVRVVLADALDRYGASLLQSRAFLDQDEVQKIVRVFTGEAEVEKGVEKSAEMHDAYSFLDLPPDEPSQAPRIVVVDRSEPAVFQRIPFNRRQLLLLGLLVLVNMIIIIAFIVLILATS